MQDTAFAPLCERYGRDYVDSVYSIIIHNMSRLKPGVDYKTEHLMGEEAWATTLPHEHKTIGNIVADLVEAGLLPLTAAGKTSGNHALYRRSNWNQN